MKIQINDQGQVFVNEYSNSLHSRTETKRRIISLSHNESNECQNWAIKDFFVKILEENLRDWLYILSK